MLAVQTISTEKCDDRPSWFPVTDLYRGRIGARPGRPAPFAVVGAGRETFVDPAEAGTRTAEAVIGGT